MRCEQVPCTAAAVCIVRWPNQVPRWVCGGCANRTERVAQDMGIEVGMEWVCGEEAE